MLHEFNLESRSTDEGNYEDILSQKTARAANRPWLRSLPTFEAQGGNSLPHQSEEMIDDTGVGMVGQGEFSIGS